MNHRPSITLSFLFIACACLAQVYTFPSDQQQRGYYDRPYERYEAEPNLCATTGVFLEPDDDQRTLQAEASHQQAVQLTQGQDVSWQVGRGGDGLTIRFSLPDNETGNGTNGTLAIYAGQEKIGELTVFSAWAWQYCSATYPTNDPKNGPVVRMKFDEAHTRLSRALTPGETLRLVRTDDHPTLFTIDFVELETVPDMVTFESLSDGNKVAFSGQGDIADFIAANEGKTIYIPAGRYETQKRIYLRSQDNTHLVGAGMWYTEVYFAAPSTNANTYDKRGIEANKSNLLIEGIYFNTANQQRYYNNDDSKQVGKAFMGSFGRNSIIRQCWVEHFECGGWIGGYDGTVSENLQIEHCRFRNNYADGINCAHGSNGHTVQHCSFRNNGDDDMASWTDAVTCKNITFAYCTAENNWRASSLGFFGGTNHHAHHLYIVDGLESGARVNADFGGNGFGSTGTILLHDITIERCGCVSGSKGTKGDFWGNRQGALNIGGGNNYDIRHLHLSDITLLRSRGDAIFVRSGNKKLVDVRLDNMTADEATGYGIFYTGVQGEMDVCNLHLQRCERGEHNTIPSALTVTECQYEAIDNTDSDMRPFDPSAPFYNLLGSPVDSRYHGIVIQSGRTFLRP